MIDQRPSGYSLSGHIDGHEFEIVTDTPQRAERAFTRAARRAWLRRKLPVLRGLPARELEPVSAADTYHDVSVGGRRRCTEGIGAASDNEQELSVSKAHERD